MLHVIISDEDRTTLSKERYEHPDVHVQRRFHALYFKSLSYNHKEICELVGISYTTLEKILKAYKEGGLQAVRQVTYYTPQSELNDHRQTLEEYFKEHPPSTIAQACKVIFELSGVQRKETQKILARNGHEALKTGNSS